MKEFFIKKIFPSILLLTLIGGGLFYYQTAQGVNRTWDGGGTDGTCGGSAGDGNKWACAANWSGDTAPTASDVAIFDGTSTKDATIAANISVAGISINAGYTGTITQSGSFTVTVGSSHYSQADGTFTGGSGAIAITGTYTQSGGTFTSTSGTLTIGANLISATTIFTLSGGTFNHNSGTATFDPTHGCGDATYTIDVVTSLTLYNIILNSGGGCSTYNIFTPGSGDTIIAANDLTFSGGYMYGTWEVQGNVSIGTSAVGGWGTLTMTETGSKTYTYGASGIGPHLRINNAALSVSANTGTTALSVQYFSLLAGTFTAPSGTFTLGQNLVSSDTFFVVSGGAFNPNNGTMVLVPFHGCTTQTYTIDVATSLTLYDVVLNSLDYCSQFGAVTIAAGDTIVVANDLTLTSGILYGVWEVQGDYTVGSGADGGTATLSFTGGNNQAYTDQGGNEPDGDITINKSGGTVTLASNADWNAASQDLTVMAGTLFAPDKNISTTALTVGASGALSLMGSQTLTLGGTLANSGTVKIWGSGVCGGGDNALIRSSSTGVQRSWTGAGVFTLYDIDVRDMAGSATITLYSSANTANNGANWTFSGGACPGVPKALGLPSGKFDLQSGKLNLR